MKTVNYFWYGLTSFVEGYAPFFSMLTSLATAFAISIIFPPITLLVFALAFLVSTGLAIKQIKDARQKNQFMQELQEKLKEEQEIKIKLKKQYHDNKEHYEHLIELINHAQHYKLTLRKAYTYCDFIFEKIRHMSHDDRETFLSSPSCKQINQIMTHLQKNDISEQAVEAQTQKLEKIIKPMIGKDEFPHFIKTHQLDDNNIKKKLDTLTHRKPEHASLDNFKQSKFASFIAGVKTSLLTFAFASSITTIVASIALGMSPLAIIAAVPLAAFMVSLGLMAFAIIIGMGAGLIYHQSIAPHKALAIETSTKLPALEQKNHELTDKINLEKTLIEEQQQHLKEIEEDNPRWYAQVKLKVDALHNKTDLEYFKSHKLSVKDALHVANHPQIKDHHAKLSPSIIKNEDPELLSNIINQLSPEGKKLLLKQLQDTPSAHRPERMRDGG